MIISVDLFFNTGENCQFLICIQLNILKSLVGLSTKDLTLAFHMRTVLIKFLKFGTFKIVLNLIPEAKY